MEVKRLLSDELTYELQVRGAPTDGTVLEKRQRLGGLLRLEKLGAAVGVSSRVHSFVEQEEIDTCSKKTDELREAILSFDVENAANDYKRIQSRLLHVVGRLGRLPDGDSKTALLTCCSELLGSLEDLVAAQQPHATMVPRAESQDRILDDANPPLKVNALDEPNVLLPNVLHSTARPHALALAACEPQGTADGVLNSPQVFNAQQSGQGRRPSEAVSAANGAGIAVGDLLGYPELPIASGEMPMVGGDASRDRPGLRMFNSPRVSFVGPTVEGVGPVRRGSGIGPWSGFEMTHPRRESVQSPAYCFKMVSGWGLQFDGNLSVTNFLERVEELRTACGISRVDLFGTAVLLFSGSALTWFRSIRETVRGWDHLVFLLRTTYLSPEYEEDVWNDIRNRSQGPDERAAIFIAVMENLFRKLSERPDESKRLTIIRRNLLPYLQNQLALRRVTAISELIQACQAIEGVRLRTERIRPPPTNPRLVAEPQLMYRPPRSYGAAAIETSAVGPIPTDVIEGASASTAPMPPGVPGSRAIRCFNCDGLGHVARNCNRPRVRRCYRCGRADVTIRTCPSCSGNGVAVRGPTEP